MSTEIWLKRFDKRSFKTGEVERSTSSGKDGEFVVTVLAGTERVFQKMLFNSVDAVIGDDLRSTVCLAGTGNLCVANVTIHFIILLVPNILNKIFMFKRFVNVIFWLSYGKKCNYLITLYNTKKDSRTISCVLG